jgi:hypothetical protein
VTQNSGQHFTSQRCVNPTRTCQSGASFRRGGLTKAGNSAARRLLIEAAWCYRFPARVSRELLLRQEEQPKPVREIAWKAQLRLVPAIASSPATANKAVLEVCPTCASAHGRRDLPRRKQRLGKEGAALATPQTGTIRAESSATVSGRTLSVPACCY